jgi:hypothetical protein
LPFLRRKGTKPQPAGRRWRRPEPAPRCRPPPDRGPATGPPSADRRLEAPRVAEQRGDVPEHDARFGVVGMVRIRLFRSYTARSNLCRRTIASRKPAVIPANPPSVLLLPPAGDRHWTSNCFT